MEVSAADLRRCEDADANSALLAAAQDALMCTGLHLHSLQVAGPLAPVLKRLLLCCQSCGRPARDLRMISAATLAISLITQSALQSDVLQAIFLLSVQPLSLGRGR